jgi:Tfp pilus assembly protein PilX
MNIRKRQAGLTMISWVILILLIGFVALFGFKLVPLYMDYMTINAALNSVAHQTAEGTSASGVHSAIEKQFNVNDVSVISADDVKIGTDPNSNNMTLTLDYDARTGFVANIDLIMHFHKIYQVTPN